MPAHLVDGPHLDMSAVEVGVEQAHAVGVARHFFIRRGARQDKRLVGDPGGGDPDLLAGQHIVSALPLGRGADFRRVQAGVGLGDGKACLVFAADQRRQHARLLFLGAEHHHRVEPEDVHVHRRSAAHAGAGFGDGLHQHRGFRDAKP